VIRDMKIKFSTLLNVVLATFFVTTLVYNVVVSRSADWEPLLPYDPWVDWNDDGEIDVFDKVAVGARFGSTGTPITKASIEYDSDWINITGKAGQYFNITHNLNITDWDNMGIIVDITGKTTLDNGVLQRYLGLTSYIPGWNRTYGGTGSDVAFSVVQTDDGGYAIGGYTESFDVNGDAWLVKTDASGDVEWNRTYGGISGDIAFSLVQTSDGGYALGGFTNSFGAGDFDFWLVKTNSTGHMQWNRTYGGTDRDCGRSLVQTSDGGYAIAGYTRSFGAGYYDFWLVKTNSTGHMQWNRTYGGTDGDWAYSMVQTTDGGYALTGQTNSFGAGSDSWLVKTNSTGHMQWNQTYGGLVYSVIQTKDGGYALAGVISLDFLLVKVDVGGNVQWNGTYGGTDHESASSVVQTNDGGYALAGIKGLEPPLGDFWLVRTDAAGNMQWSKTYGGISLDAAYSMVQTNDGGYVIVGETDSFGAGSDDFWLVKTKTCVESGLAWTDSTADTIILYRGATDPYWNYVRVRIWKIKTP